MINPIILTAKSYLINQKTLIINSADKAAFTLDKFVWQHNHQEYSLWLNDIVGIKAIEQFNNQQIQGFLVNAYPLVTAGIFSHKQRQLKQYYFACPNSETLLFWLQGFHEKGINVLGRDIAKLPRLLVIINPKSGKKQAEKTFTQIRPLLENSYVEFKVIKTPYQGYAYQFCQELVLTEWDGIIVVGGDGSLYEVINGLMAREDAKDAIKIPLGIIPGGTGNGLSKTLLDKANEPNNPLSAAFLMIKGKPLPLDLWKIEQNNHQYYSFLSLSWGFISDVDIESDKLKFLGSLRNDIYALIRMLNLRVYPAKMSLLLANNSHWQVIEDKFILLWAMNTSWATSNLKPAPNADFSDGIIDLFIIRQGVSLPQLLKAFLKCYTGDHVSLPYVEYYQVKSFFLEPLTSKGTLAIDGELVKYAPVKITVLPQIAGIFSK